jgi:hypothetical protein
MFTSMPAVVFRMPERHFCSNDFNDLERALLEEISACLRMP